MRASSSVSASARVEGNACGDVLPSKRMISSTGSPTRRAISSVDGASYDSIVPVRGLIPPASDMRGSLSQPPTQANGAAMYPRAHRRTGSNATLILAGPGLFSSGFPMTEGITCSSCGRENRSGRKFCADCGARLEAEAQPGGPAVERRLVTVLFADLVGFTPMSEARDAEDVRELLSRYFDGARQVIERYGGTVEKFIGDAVMAVWGTPVAQEDDAERAVRA